MSTDSVDIWIKSHHQAANIRDVIQLVTPALLDGVAQLGAVIATLETTKEFGQDTRQDVMSAIVEARQHHERLSSRLEQVLADLDVILRSIDETSGLTRQTKERLGVVTGNLQEAGDIATDHLNTAANAATIAGGRQWLMLDGEKLVDVLRLVESLDRDKALMKLDSAKFAEWEQAVDVAAVKRKALGKDDIGDA